jgi:toxin ParE1/3/4
VGNYTLSAKADADIEDIAETSVKQWGLVRAEKYLRDLHDALRILADFPHLGRDASHVRPGY